MNRWFPFLTLVLLSAFSLALYAARFLYSGQITYIFLLWNLFLAWMPLVFAWLAVTWRKWPPLLLNDIWASLDEPRTLIISGLLALLLLFAYLIFTTPLRPSRSFSR